MVLSAQLYTASVMHQRLNPKKNGFRYGVYYLALPLSESFSKNQVPGFYPKDIGYRDGRSPLEWAKMILSPFEISQSIRNIMLITMPRVLGYVFNPVSFYFCLDNKEELRAVICEVHNTFGEQHTYICARPDGEPINPNEWLKAEKTFHVSPFFERSGHYKFKFDLQKDTLSVWIDYYDSDNKKQLLTSLIGNFSPLSKKSLRKAFWTHPLLTLKVISLIHFQAIKLVLKGIRYIPKPKQKMPAISTTESLKKTEP